LEKRRAKGREKRKVVDRRLQERGKPELQKTILKGGSKIPKKKKTHNEKKVQDVSVQPSKVWEFSKRTRSGGTGVVMSTRRVVCQKKKELGKQGGQRNSRNSPENPKPGTNNFKKKIGGEEKKRGGPYWGRGWRE